MAYYRRWPQHLYWATHMMAGDASHIINTNHSTNQCKYNSLTHTSTHKLTKTSSRMSRHLNSMQFIQSRSNIQHRFHTLKPHKCPKHISLYSPEPFICSGTSWRAASVDTLRGPAAGQAKCDRGWTAKNQLSSPGHHGDSCIKPCSLATGDD